MHEPYAKCCACNMHRAEDNTHVGACNMHGLGRFTCMLHTCIMSVQHSTHGIDADCTEKRKLDKCGIYTRQRLRAYYGHRYGHATGMDTGLHAGVDINAL